MPSAAVTVAQVLKQNGNLQLPDTQALLSKTALDEEEKLHESGLGALSSTPGHAKKAKPRASKAQGDWSKLEGSLEPRVTARGTDAEFSSEHGAAAGRGGSLSWHEIPVARMTPELQRDLRVLENRQHLDPKRFYKSGGSGRRRGELPERVHVGTVVVGAHEFYSGRVPRRERRKSVMGEVLADERVVRYTRDKFQKLQASKQIKKRVVDPAAKRRRRSSEW